MASQPSRKQIIEQVREHVASTETRLDKLLERLKERSKRPVPVPQEAALER